MLWTWFEEDHLLQKMGHPRLHSDEEGYFFYPYLWDVLIERICLEYTKKLRDTPNYHEGQTTMIEFCARQPARRVQAGIRTSQRGSGRQDGGDCISMSPGKNRCARTGRATIRINRTAFWSTACRMKSWK